MEIPPGTHLPRPMPKRPRIGEGIFDREVVERLLKFSPLRIEPQTRIYPPKLRLQEALTNVLKEASIALHKSKPAFSEATEARWTAERIKFGDAYRCRCWVLLGEDTETVLAACTLRLNPFTREEPGKGKQWAQVMNISAHPEGNGNGTMMFQMIEKVLRTEGIRIVILYPANNGCAPRFWGNLGFKEHGGQTGRPSLLPHAETSQINGNIIQEVDVITGYSLPRWEKDLTVRTVPRRDGNGSLLMGNGANGSETRC
eukprot:GEMP01063349.1.p1 GENE.GEMP01063349.1~~GEMP01063349.1.p1  ORF type:complete len:257 (+),score=41.80 GEMP01063349.1:99-869(+)